MNVVVNGETKRVRERETVAGLVRTLAGAGERGVAVAVNGEVVPRSRWQDRSLNEDDDIEVLRAVGGG